MVLILVAAIAVDRAERRVLSLSHAEVGDLVDAVSLGGARESAAAATTSSEAEVVIRSLLLSRRRRHQHGDGTGARGGLSQLRFDASQGRLVRRGQIFLIGIRFILILRARTLALLGGAVVVIGIALLIFVRVVFIIISRTGNTKSDRKTRMSARVLGRGACCVCCACDVHQCCVLCLPRRPSCAASKIEPTTGSVGSRSPMIPYKTACIRRRT